MKLVLFDVDGTLIDSQRIICAAMRQAYEDHGMVCPPVPQVLSIVGLSLEHAFRRLAGDADHPIDSLAARYKEAFFALRAAGTEPSPLYPGARAAIDALRGRDDIVLGLATGKSRRGVAAMVEQHDLQGIFVTVQTSDTAPSKPDPAMVLQAMRETGVDADDTVMIGDTAFDMAMARAAGATAVGVSWGYHPIADLYAAGAGQVIDTFDALAPAVEKLWPATPRTINAASPA
ncbi:HAD family hydrolase [Pseudolabrys taiwanensis]|uniref:HAD family hydrolase n=1 Tax=Pseudolabrys taiwanensis TaxID=331696 RepID=A0A345ZRR4_9HYPH|nr:HAD-IA family hydrolase [Pseudolabrys taiwanensis]AXK79611.1 HAD family hydrolase [Pseudolabrys taiwanensis]